MLDGYNLRIAYQAADVFVSASDFETLGNSVVEAVCAKTVVAVEPAQGHLEFIQDEENGYFVEFENADAARAKLNYIVESGLGSKALPKFEELSERLRTSNFAEEFSEDVLSLALAASDRRRARTCGYGLECLVRGLALLAWLIMWIFMRGLTRTIFMFSRFPSFEVLGALGSSIESQPSESVKAKQIVRAQPRPERCVKGLKSL